MVVLPPSGESGSRILLPPQDRGAPLGGSVLLRLDGRPAAPARRRVPLHHLFAAGLAVLYVGLVLLTYGRRSLTVDEAYSDAMSRLPWSELVQVLVQRELNGSLHTVLLKVLGLGGGGELAIRAPSVVAVGLAAWLFYRLLLRHGVALALVGEVLLLSLWPVAEAATTARSYGLLLLGVVLLQLLVQDGALSRPATAAAYGLVAGATLYLHFLAGLVVLAHAVAELITARAGGRRARWLWAALPFAALAAPVGAFLLFGSDGQQTSWIPSLDAGVLVHAGLDLVALGGPLPLRVLRVVLLLGALLAAVRLVLRHPGRRQELPVLALVLVLPPVLVVLVSVAEPLLVPRYLWLVLPALVALLVLGLSAARSTRQAAGVAAPLALATVLGLATPPATQDDYRAAATAIARTAAAGDVVVPLNPFRTAVVAYYAPRDSPAAWPVRPRDAEVLLDGSGYEDLRCVPADLAGAPSVYVVGQLRAEDALEIARCSGRVLDLASFDASDSSYGFAMFARFDRAE